MVVSQRGGRAGSGCEDSSGYMALRERGGEDALRERPQAVRVSPTLLCRSGHAPFLSCRNAMLSFIGQWTAREQQMPPPFPSPPAPPLPPAHLKTKNAAAAKKLKTVRQDRESQQAVCLPDAGSHGQGAPHPAGGRPHGIPGHGGTAGGPTEDPVPRVESHVGPHSRRTRGGWGKVGCI